MNSRELRYGSMIRVGLILSLLIPVGLVSCAIGTEPDELPTDKPDGAQVQSGRWGMVLSDEERAKALQERWDRRTAARPREEITGVVQDLNGAPVQGVLVSAGSSRAITDKNGFYRIPDALLGAHIITFQHSDYVIHQDGVLVLPYQPPHVSAVLMHRETPIEVDSGDAFTVHDDHVTVIFPANALVFKDSGQPVHGNVVVQLTAIDPLQDKVVLAAPAPLEGERLDGTLTSLRSFHMFELEMRQGSRELDLQKGVLAQMQIELPASAEIPPGKQIPMWYHDATKGRWVQEHGTNATIHAQNGTVVATAAIPHFTAWNVDSFNDTVAGRFSYVATDAASLEYILTEESAVWAIDPPSQGGDGQWKWMPPGSSWKMKSVPFLESPDEKVFFTNLPQCGSDFSFKYKIRAKYTNDDNLYDLEINPPSSTVDPICTFGPNTNARVEFTSAEVCNFMNCLGANRNLSNQLVSPGDDGNLFGMDFLTVIGGSNPTKDLNNALNIVQFNNGIDGRGVQINGVQRGFATWRMPFDYKVQTLGKVSSLPSNDPGYNYYNTTSKTPGGAYYYDIDKDGVKDLVDNCVNHPNPSQADSNANGIGDVCEAWCYVPVTDPDRIYYDYDLDTIDDLCDNKPSAVNPSQAP